MKKIQNFLTIYKNQFFLFGILLVGLLLRLNRLNFQSLWYDELFTVVDCNPSHSLKYLLKKYTSDNHPPLFYFFQWIFFQITSYKHQFARIPSVIFGVMGIWALYHFIKSFANKEIALIGALILALNIYHIEYSQEARPYTLLFFLSCLSFKYLYDILINQKTTISNCIIYIITTTSMLYCHYFSIYMVIVHSMILLYIISSLNHKWQFWLLFPKQVIYIILGLAISVLLFSPMIPTILKLSKITGGGDAPNSVEILFQYINSVFGDNMLLIIIFFLLLILLIFKEIKKQDKEESDLIFIFLIIWLFTGMYLPYLKSLTSNPTMHIRYFSAVYPALFLLFVLGLKEMKPSKNLFTFILIIIVTISIVNIFYEKKLYFTQTKSEYRAISKFFVENNPENYPIRDISDPWDLWDLDKKGLISFYPKQFGFNPVVVSDATFLSTLSNKSNNAKGIWILDAWWLMSHVEFEKELYNRGFVKEKELQSFGAQAKKFVKK